MVDLSISHTGERERNGGLFGRFSDFLALMGAAVRAARAVEAGHQPRAQDMAILGIPTKLPNSW